MKHTKKKRILALVLCMILVLSTGIAAFANENVGLQSVACSATNLKRVIKNANGEQIGTLTADVPEGAFFASSSNANIQMEVEPDSGEDGVLNRVQQQMEAEGVTGYEINNYVMTNVTFYVNGEKQTPQQPIKFHVSGTNLDTQNVMAFADNRQNAPTLMDATTDENGGLQFTVETFDAETVVYGVYDVTVAETNETADNTAVQTADDGAAVQTVDTPTQTDGQNLSIKVENQGGSTVTFQYYLVDGTNYENATQIYRDTKQYLQYNATLTSLPERKNYQIVAACKMNGTDTCAFDSDETIKTDQVTYRIFLQKSRDSESGPIQMFDYQVNQGKNQKITYRKGASKKSTEVYSINDGENYKNADGKTVGDESTRLGVANTGGNGNGGNINNKNNYANTRISYKYTDPEGKYTADLYVSINDWVKGTYSLYNVKGNGAPKQIKLSGNTAVKGIIEGLSDYKKGTLKMTRNSDGKQIYEPGLFSTEDKAGKQILSGYKANFTKNGDSYTLSTIVDANDVERAKAGSDFFPLDNLLATDESESNYDVSNTSGHNYYFGMRYDIEFSVGDYLGDLTYTFAGDDDLWVVLDAGTDQQKVVLDVGGIHGKVEDSVDLWKYILNSDDYTKEDKQNLSEQDREKKHTLTVLYMERGANASNCEMNFTIPNSEIINPEIDRPVDFTFTKVDAASTETVLPGAVFGVYTDEQCTDANKVEELTSDSNGKVTLKSLYAGKTYYLKEITAPNGYKVNDTVYKVAAKSENDTTVASMTTLEDPSKKVTTVPNAKITWEQNKTVKVKDYEKRTYDITLDASSTIQRITEADPVDVVLVFDRSGSMKFRANLTKYGDGKTKVSSLEESGVYYYITDNKAATVYRVWFDGNNWKSVDDSYWNYSEGTCSGSATTLNGDASYQFYTTDDGHDRLYYLKKAAADFANGLCKQSPSSKIALVTFTKEANGGTEAVNTDFALSTIGEDDNLADLNSIIDKLTTNGGTQPSLGLERAKDILKKDTETANRKKYVILLTDGCPADDSYENQAEVAESLREKTGCTVITVAVGMADGNTDLEMAKNKLKKEVASSEALAYEATNAAELTAKFKEILANIVTSDSITGATVTDYIDSRFEVVDSDGNALKAGDSVASGTLKYDETQKQYYVEWTNQTIGSKNGTTAEWTNTITVKAKENFIGGNMIPTNGSTSGITVGDNTKLFPKPSVNVKLLTPSIGNKKQTYYKGDTIGSSNFSGELLGTYEMTELDGTTKLTAGNGIPELTADQLETLKNGKKVEIPYSYTDSSTDIEGTFVYEYKNTKYDAEGAEVDPLNDHTATKVGQDVEKYELTVTFVPKTVAKRKDLLKDTAVLEPNTDANISGTVVNDVSVEGTYKVHVLALWAIVKQSTSTDSDGNHPMLSGAKFELLKGSDVCYTGKSNSNGFVEWYKGADKVLLNEIEKGTYTLRETSAPAGYAKSEVQWTIEITDTSVTIRDAAGKNITATKLRNGVKTYDTYAYENTPVYELPSTGGKGIFLYTIGGMLLMGAAAWILYKNKCREVLKR